MTLEGVLAKYLPESQSELNQVLAFALTTFTLSVACAVVRLTLQAFVSATKLIRIMPLVIESVVGAIVLLTISFAAFFCLFRSMLSSQEDRAS